MTQPIEQTIYERLDTLTNGIEAFLAAGRNETWRSDVYYPLIVACLKPRRILFGLCELIDGERIPSPAFSIDLKDGVADIDSLVLDTLLGHTRGREGAHYCAEFLAELITRKQSGFFTAP